MAGFSQSGGSQQNILNKIHPENLFLYRNEQICYNRNKGFELWKKQHTIQDIYCSVSDEWSATIMMRQRGGKSCLDCGNQAKKECLYMRCRTCCKSRGFQCSTHVKSTWVPDSKRRERQKQQQQQQRRGENPKRQREKPCAPSLTCTRLHTATTSGLEVNSKFPAVLNSPTVFRCVRVSSIDNPDGQYAYQTAVRIGGRVFKGILYDQGPEANQISGESSSGGGGCGEGGGIPSDFVTAATTTTSTAVAVTTTAALIDPSLLHPTRFNAFMAGTQFFPLSTS